MHDGESDGLDGGPPIVLVAALATALLIAVGLVAAFSSLGGDDASEPISESAGTTTTTDDNRVLLTVSVDGSGSGQVEITPSDVSCNRSCEYRFTPGRRVVATAQAAEGSTFDGWGDACSGEERCSFVMDQPRTLSATFTEEEPAEEGEEEILCEEDLPLDEQDPNCVPDAPSEPREPGPDCFDNIDNDDDGLTDTEQDPDCEATGSEAAGATPPGGAPAPRPPAAQPNECTDGEDNDNDGLTDRAQDPDCESGRSESG